MKKSIEAMHLTCEICFMHLAELFYIQSIFLGAGLAFLIGIAQLFIRTPILKNYMLLMVGLCISIVLVYFWYTQSRLADTQMHVVALQVPALFFMGPALFFFSKGALDEDYRLGLWAKLTFLPGIIAFIYVGVAYFFDDYKVEYFINFFSGGEPHLNEYLIGAAFISNSFYYLWLVKDTAYFYNAELFKQESSVRYMVGLILVSYIVTLIAFFAIVFRSTVLLGIAASSITLIVSISLIIVFRAPEFFQVLQEFVQEQKYQRSLLGDVDLKKIASHIEQLMNDEQRFTDENLSLTSLAQDLELTPHQLSEYLNKELSKNFASFVNEYRIAEAKRLLLADDEETILGIAYKVGFNSKSTFNAVFMKFVGKSPTLYKSKNRK